MKAFYHPLLDTSKKRMFNWWRDIYIAIKDHVDGDTIQNCKANVWKSLDKIFEFMEKKIWSNSEQNIYKHIRDMEEGIRME